MEGVREATSRQDDLFGQKQGTFSTKKKKVSRSCENETKTKKVAGACVFEGKKMNQTPNGCMGDSQMFLFRRRNGQLLSCLVKEAVEMVLYGEMVP